MRWWNAFRAVPDDASKPERKDETVTCPTAPVDLAVISGAERIASETGDQRVYWTALGFDPSVTPDGRALQQREEEVAAERERIARETAPVREFTQTSSIPDERSVTYSVYGTDFESVKWHGIERLTRFAYQAGYGVMEPIKVERFEDTRDGIVRQYMILRVRAMRFDIMQDAARLQEEQSGGGAR